MALLTTAQVKALLGISDSSQDEQIAALLPGAQRYVEDQTARYELAQVVEQCDGHGAYDLILSRRPVVIDVDHEFELRVDTTRDFTDDDTVRAAADYYVDKGAGMVRCDEQLPTTPGAVQVTFWAGDSASTYPESLLSVIAEVVGLMLNRIGAAGLSTEGIGQYSYSVAQIDSSHLSLASRMALTAHAPPPEVM